MLGEIKDERLEKFNFIASRSIKDSLAQRSRRRSISTSQLLREIVEGWIRKQKLEDRKDR